MLKVYAATIQRLKRYRTSPVRASLRVNWDNKKGLGRTPDGVVAERDGMKIEMEPGYFLSVLLKKNTPINPVVEKAIDEGRPIAMPMLMINYDAGRKVFIVNGHEGRNRTAALRKRGVRSIPVLLHLWDSAKKELHKRGKKPHDIIHETVLDEYKARPVNFPERMG